MKSTRSRHSAKVLTELCGTASQNHRERAHEITESSTESDGLSSGPFGPRTDVRPESSESEQSHSQLRQLSASSSQQHPTSSPSTTVSNSPRLVSTDRAATSCFPNDPYLKHISPVPFATRPSRGCDSLNTAAPLRRPCKRVTHYTGRDDEAPLVRGAAAGSPTGQA